MLRVASSLGQGSPELSGHGPLGLPTKCASQICSCGVLTHESQDTGVTASCGNSHDGSGSRGRCSGLARCAGMTAGDRNDQAGREGKLEIRNSKLESEWQSFGFRVSDFEFPDAP